MFKRLLSLSKETKEAVALVAITLLTMGVAVFASVWFINTVAEEISAGQAKQEARHTQRCESFCTPHEGFSHLADRFLYVTCVCRDGTQVGL